MRSDKLRRRLAVGLLVIAAGVGVVLGRPATASPDEFDWGSAPTVSSVYHTPDSALAAQVENYSAEFDWG